MSHSPHHKSLLWLCIFLLGCLLSRCQTPNAPTEQLSRPTQHRNNSFYYWQSVWKLSDESRRYLVSQNVEHLYLKLFDVAWNPEQQQAIPMAPLIVQDTVPQQWHVIPTIFITNEAIEQTLEADIPLLAQKISQKIQTMVQTNAWKVAQWQFDCDWTNRTQTRYFSLLQHIRQNITSIDTTLRLSATIRLHQVKYVQETGIPPVERRMLMVYNTDDVQNLQTENAILRYKTVQRYTSKLAQYPLPLDVALPIFSWAVMFRNGGFRQIIGQITLNDLTQQTEIFHRIGKNRFKVQKNAQWKGVYLLQNDHIRLDQSTTSEVLQTAYHIATYNRADSLTVALFHFAPDVIQQFGQDNIAAIWQTWKTQ